MAPPVVRGHPWHIARAFGLAGLVAPMRFEQVPPSTPGRVAVVMVLVGSELLGEGAVDLIASFGLSQALIAMTVVALALSVEELARTVPAAVAGRPDVSVGTVVGSVLGSVKSSDSATSLQRRQRDPGGGVAGVHERLMAAGGQPER
ncbi:hypothetical protein HJG43_11690 [Kineosporiaceae bacterium SCSIO 59966]|nr:hypothetical protein HJG43_11690 [Kineosporiaceae bacterium SCSIO 59966]